jgi:hypothetical protein
MSVEGQKFFPGDEATPRQVLELADEYRRAADSLLPMGRRGRPLSRAPFRLAAIHAIELYLNAFLMACGHSSAYLRGLHHDLTSRRTLAAGAGLHLRKKTSRHLDAVSEAREYLVMRYGPEMTGAASQPNRLEATLNEVAEKVSKQVNSMRG